MAIYTEEIQTDVTIKHDGAKEIRLTTITLKDGVVVGHANHRSVVAYDAAVPADIAAFINAKKGKQPTLPPQAE